jgi:hypothetical protein
MSSLIPFPDDTTVFRAAKSKTWFSADGKKGAPPAFYRRSPLNYEHPDHKGLSVGTSREEITDSLEGKFYGFISLEVGDVRNLKLDVVRDSNTHGNITDGEIELPFRHPTDLAIIAESDHLAIALADLSTGYPELIPAKKDR